MEIITKNLKVGLVVKNYRELCKLLGADIKDGKSKKLQVKDWERYFRFSRDDKEKLQKVIREKTAIQITIDMEVLYKN